MNNIWKKYLTKYKYKNIICFGIDDNFGHCFFYNHMYVNKYKNYNHDFHCFMDCWIMWDGMNMINYNKIEYISYDQGGLDDLLPPQLTWTIPGELEYIGYSFNQFKEYERKIIELLKFWSVKNHLKFEKKAQKNVINIYMTLSRKELPNEIILKILEYITHAELFLCDKL